MILALIVATVLIIGCIYDIYKDTQDIKAKVDRLLEIAEAEGEDE